MARKPKESVTDRLSNRKEALAQTGDLAKDTAKTEAVADASPTKAELAAKAKADKAELAAKAKADKAASAAKAKADKEAAKVDKAEAEGKNIIDRNKYSYEATKDAKTAGGRASVDNNDPLASALRGKTADEVIALVKANGGEANSAWESLNYGLARMAAGNVLRKLARRSEGVTIDGNIVKLAVPEKAAA